jgi:hypothetical protein
VANHFKTELLDIARYRLISTMNCELTCADGDGTTPMTVLKDDGRHIQATYREFVEVFRKVKAETLQLHRSIDHAIYLQPIHNLPHGQTIVEWSFELIRVERNSLNCVV